MNFPTGVGAGIVLGACAGKVFRPQIQREIDVLRQDISYERELHDKGHVGFDEFIAHEKTYPSIYRRAQSFYYKCYRGVRNVRHAPYEVKYFVQRGRRGWSDQDLWNVDVFLVDMLVGALEQYKKESFGHPADTTEEDWETTIDEIIWGLRQYQLFWDNWHELKIDDYIQAEKEAMNALARSFRLLGENLPGIWI